MEEKRVSLISSWWRSRRYYVIALAVLLLLDGIMSVWAVVQGAAYEANAHVAPLMETTEGQALLIAMKAFLAVSFAYCSYLAYKIQRESAGRRKKTAYWTEVAMWCWNIGIMAAVLGNNVAVFL